VITGTIAILARGVGRVSHLAGDPRLISEAATAGGLTGLAAFARKPQPLDLPAAFRDEFLLKFRACLSSNPQGLCFCDACYDPCVCYCTSRIESLLIFGVGWITYGAPLFGRYRIAMPVPRFL